MNKQNSPQNPTHASKKPQTHQTPFPPEKKNPQKTNFGKISVCSYGQLRYNQLPLDTVEGTVAHGGPAMEINCYSLTAAPAALVALLR